ncbi:MAG: RNA-binding protein [Chloroflexi bacterium]|nr:RNA-binding protein [Chloroflexota bacterium]
MAARLHVGNLPYSATEEQLTELFSQAGTVVSVTLPEERFTGRPRGFGFVEMENSSEAEEAIRKFDGYVMDNRSLRVEMAREREERGPGYRSAGQGRSGFSGGGRQERGRREGGRGGRWAA